MDHATFLRLEFFQFGDRDNLPDLQVALPTLENLNDSIDLFFLGHYDNVCGSP
jgi:hypothetical protein